MNFGISNWTLMPPINITTSWVLGPRDSACMLAVITEFDFQSCFFKELGSSTWSKHRRLSLDESYHKERIMESSIEKFLSQIFWEMCVIWRSSNAYHYLCKCHRNAWSLSTEKSVQSDGSLDWNGGLKTSLKVEPLYYAHQLQPYLAMDRTNHPISRHPKREPFLNRFSLCTSCQSQNSLPLEKIIKIRSFSQKCNADFQRV